ncbi:hypothetical protein ACPPVO_47465 [Dactylosporangium sp. McL0621]|uniref:hypothetical protein n=1 Tax=Dactylosporangium sp. McL0621 TaxID=3415678 RepID=UPI003CE75014
MAGAVQGVRSAIDAVDGYLNGYWFANFFPPTRVVPYWVSAVVVLAHRAYLVWRWLRYRTRRRRRG